MTADPSDAAGEPAAPGLGLDPKKLKILIISTPKTGNTWLKYLLSEVYHLPIANVTFKADRAELMGYGDRWVGHQHLFPTEELRRDLNELQIQIITTVRHPADVLLSYFHYVRALAARNEFDLHVPTAQMLADGGQPGAHTLKYAQEAFSSLLLYSAAWLPFRPLLVRYENLCSDPVNELRRVTRSLIPVQESQIESAVAVCELTMMRKNLPEQSYHFRTGTTQFQQAEDKLPADILNVLANTSPYPELNARLGYSFTELPIIKTFDYSRLNPFHGHDTFTNGVSISRCVLRIYLCLIPGARTRWPDPTTAGSSDSFFNHLIEPVDQQFPVVTRLAAYIHQLRDDLQTAYPDYLGQNRWAYTQWVIYSGTVEYALHQALIAPTLVSISSLAEVPAEMVAVASSPVNYTGRLAVQDVQGQARTSFAPGDWVLITFSVTASTPVGPAHAELALTDSGGREFFATGTRQHRQPAVSLVAGEQRRITFLLQLNLPAGVYQVRATLAPDPAVGALANAGTPEILSLEVSGGMDWSGLACCYAKVIAS